MADATDRGKRVFWLMILTAFLFAVVPSIVVIEKAKEYYAFLSGWSPGPLKASSVDTVPHREIGDSEKAIELHFVEFGLTARQAKAVHLAASFNGWKKDSLPLKKGGGDRWEILVPLPEGRYYYAFDVDGDMRLDPANQLHETKGNREVSVRIVPK